MSGHRWSRNVPARHPSSFPSRDDADLSGLCERAGGERVVDDLGLLLLVALARTGGGAGAFGAADVADLAIGGVEERLDALPHQAPRSHVARLFLRPDHFGSGSIFRQDVGG